MIIETRSYTSRGTGRPDYSGYSIDMPMPVDEVHPLQDPVTILTAVSPTTTAVITCDLMQDCSHAVRGTMIVISTLDQACEVYLIGNQYDTAVGAVMIGRVEVCAANDNIMLTWDRGAFAKYIGAIFTPQVAPDGTGSITAIMQNQE